MALAARIRQPQRVEVQYWPNEKQVAFHACEAVEAVYGGAKGGGKSCALVMDAFFYGLEYPGAVIYLFRESYDDLESVLIHEWRTRIPPELYTYRETKKLAIMRNGTQVYFRYLEQAGDADKYAGRSIDYIGIDELTKHEEKAVQTLLSCLRSPRGFPVRFRGTCNPGQRGHAWVKKRYVKATDYGRQIVTDPVTGNTIAFIPATVYDNVILMRKDPAYVRRLENLPVHLRKAYLLGDWDIFAGQAFPSWSERVHVIRPFAVPRWWKRWIANDPHYTWRFVWLWFAADGDGNIYVYREYAGDSETEERVAFSEQARKVVELSCVGGEVGELELDEEGEPIQEKIDFVVTGEDAFNKHPETGKAPVDYYREGGIPWGIVRPVHGKGSRKHRAATVEEYLRPDADGKPKLYVFSTCPTLRACMPELVTDERDPEMVMDCDYDHPYDALSYGLCAWHAQYSKEPEKPKTVIQLHKEKLARLHQPRRRDLLLRRMMR